MRMNLRLLCGGMTVVSTLATAPVCAAPYVWFITDGATAQAHVGELIPSAKTLFTSTLLEPSAVLADGKATLGGKTYDQVRHTATLAFDVPK